MKLTHFPVKGIPNYLLDSDLNGEPLHLHVNEVAAGQRAHPPHQHGGYEAFYMLEGEGTLESDKFFLLLFTDSYDMLSGN